MQYYNRTQRGLAITLPVLAASIPLLILGVAMMQWEMIVTALVLSLLSLLFYKLEVTVEDTVIVIRYGIGWIRKRIPLEEVMSAEPVRNKWYYGWGIRWYPGGWIFNISGLDAVELRTAEGPDYRIGTKDPVGLAGAIQARLRNRS